MGLRSYLKGALFSVCFWEEADECPTLDYLESLQSGGKPQMQDAATLQKRLRDLSEQGPPRLEQHGRQLQNSDGIYELKAHNGARLFWFYEKDHVVVCSHGAHKPKSNSAYNPHIECAQTVRAVLRLQTAEESKDTLKPEKESSHKKRKR